VNEKKEPKKAMGGMWINPPGRLPSEKKKKSRLRRLSVGIESLKKRTAPRAKKGRKAVKKAIKKRVPKRRKKRKKRRRKRRK
jgi:hypothetical protein